MKQIVIAVDLGGTNLRAAAVDRSGAVLYRTRCETPRGERAGEIVRTIAESAIECRRNCSDFKIAAISAAVPATVSHERGLIFKAPNLPSLDNFRLASELENELGVKAFIENDANAAAVGEHWLGASKEVENSIMVTLGTGVGGGIIIDGKVLRGRDGTAGEIGHISVEPFGAPCGCGSRGCVEQYASATAIARLANELKSQYPKSKLNQIACPNANDVYQAGTVGDELALEVFRQAGFYLGVALAGLVNVLNPEMIVVGGGASAGWKLFLPELKKTIGERSYKRPARTAQISLAALGDDAGLVGASRIAFDLLT
jgi:glucokinase